MRSLILAVDAGGTKTLGKLVDLSCNKEWTFKTGAASLTNDFQLAQSNVQQVIDDLMAQAKCTPDEVTLVCGIAGAGNLERLEKFNISSVICNTIRPFRPFSLR